MTGSEENKNFEEEVNKLGLKKDEKIVVVCDIGKKKKKK